jgi:hypothetical protein
MKRAHLWLIAILMLHAFIGILSDAYWWRCFPEGGPQCWWLGSPFIYWVPLLILLYLWLRADIAERQAELPYLSVVLLPLVFPVGVPYYYWRTLPLRAAILNIGLALVYAGVCIAALWLGRMLGFEYNTVWAVY